VKFSSKNIATVSNRVGGIRKVLRMLVTTCLFSIRRNLFIEESRVEKLACSHPQTDTFKCALYLSNARIKIPGFCYHTVSKMKLFNANNMNIIQNCQQYFDVELPSNLWAKRVDRSEISLLRVAVFFVKLQLMFVSLYCSVS